VNIALLFFLCAASLPDEVPEAGIDLREYYFANRGRFFGFVAAFYLSNCLQNGFGMLMGGTTQAGVIFFLSNVAGLLGSVSLIWLRTAWWHATVLGTGLVVVLLLYGPIALT